MPKKCPSCGLFNPDSAVTCDCGADVKRVVPNARTAKSPAMANAVSLLVVVAGFIGVWFFFQNQSASRQSTATTPAPTRTINLATLLADYKDNQVRADMTYKGDSVEVTGVVGAVKKDVFDHPYLEIRTGRDFQMPALHCALSAASVGPAAELHPGDPVTVRGTVTGLLLDVQLRDCEIR
jgi:hypothetical protein